MSLGQYDFHRLGCVVSSVERTSREMERLGWKSGDIFEDHNQGIRGFFIEGAGPRMELLENLPCSSALNTFLKSGEFVFYHIGYLTYDINFSIAESREAEGKLISSPASAIAFRGSKICFVAFQRRDCGMD